MTPFLKDVLANTLNTLLSKGGGSGCPSAPDFNGNVSSLSLRSKTLAI